MSRKEEKGNRGCVGAFWNDIKSKYEYTVLYYDADILQFMVDSKCKVGQESIRAVELMEIKKLF